MALVIVLVFIALIALLVVAFLGSVDLEFQSARSYDSAVNVKQLVSTATNVVTSQIIEGTRSEKTVRPPGSSSPIVPGNRLSWASQPGMIRTWDDTGAGWKLFKLYSARTMVAAFPGRYSTADHLVTEVPDDWPSQTALFTDLNEPVTVEDPAGKILRDGKKHRASYPILDPLALQEIDGFSITRPTGYGGALDAKSQPAVNEATDPTLPPQGGKSGNPAPMPVAWIYVLKDGTLTTPTGTRDAGRAATWTGADPAFAPNRENPIVGRIAFWTDDETCKLNVNTASEPTPWDTPRAITIQDLNYGKFQPAQREFQRFPGHPLMSALSPVLFPEKVRGVATPLTAAQKELIYDLIPRVAGGGTKAATVPAGTAAAIVPDGDRLFANVDEFLFNPSRIAVTKDPAYKSLGLEAARLQRARFFLTANSRAPELNLFGQPRVALWPIPQDAAKRTAYDRLAAFCSTLGDSSRGGTRPFYFQRNDSRSPKADYESIARNKEVHAYLQQLTGNPLPGYGGSFLEKWGQDRDQVLTEIFDYIRCINLRDPLLVKKARDEGKPSANYVFADNGQVSPIQIADTQGFGRFFTVSQAGMHFICSQEGDTGILTGNKAPNDKLGAGERIVNTAFLFEPWSPSLGFHPIYENLFFDVTFGDGFTLNGQPLKMRAGGKPLTAAIGSGWHNNGREHGGAGGLRGPMQDFGGGGYQWVSQAQATLPDSKTKVTGIRITGDAMTFVGGEVTIRIYGTASADANYLVQTVKLRMPDGSFPVPKLVRTGTEDYRSGSDVRTAREFWWTFGGFTPAGKTGVQGRYQRLGEVPQAPGLEYADARRRWVESPRASGIPAPPGFKMGSIFRDEDVVRTVVPDHGDIRLIAARRNVEASEFVKVRDQEWNSPNDRMLHIFTSPGGSHFLYGFGNEPGDRPGGADRVSPLGGTFGGIPGAAPDDQLTASPLVKYHYSRLPEIRPGAGRKYNRWNDYDNGVSTWSDGSYINKPDEGNFTSTNSSYTYFAWNTATDSTGTYFSPSRLVPSAGMLGSLPTGVKRHNPAAEPHAWETLLFRPELRKDASGRPHPGTQSPKDHLLMDLFWMPVIEPYAISEPFSTAGKINLNYEIAPFSYIRRATALHGAMKSEEPLVLPNAAAQIYKLWDHETNDHPFKLPNDAKNRVQDPLVKSDWDKAYRGLAPFDKLRRPIDVAKTLAQADQRFENGQVFRSASEICELHLVRAGENLADYENGKIWPDALLTGDNTRERPYANLYARLTTRSNTFTIHIRAQVLRQSGGSSATDWAVWREGRDQQLAEQRSAVTIERYIDPSDPALARTGKEADFAHNRDLTADRFFRTRIVSAKKFSP